MLPNNFIEYPQYSWQCALMHFIQVSYALQSSPLPNLYNDIATLSCTGTITLKRVSSFFKYRLNLSHKSLKVLYLTRVRSLNSLSVHDSNNKHFTNSDKNNAWMSTTCLTSMYKNMYNLKSKTRYLLLSSIATMFVEIQSKNKQKKTRSEAKRRLVKPIEWSKLIFFEKFTIFGAYIKKFNTFTFWSMVFRLGPHSVNNLWGDQGSQNWFF
jgi:hypothetical protein